MLVWLAAKLAGEAMERVGQTAVLGELLAGVLIGPGVLGQVHESEVLHALAELGVLILLFEVGLESDLGDLLRAGPQATLVALVGVVAPSRSAHGVMSLARPPRAGGRLRRRDIDRDHRGIHPRRAAYLGRLRTPAPAKVCSGRRSWTTPGPDHPGGG